MGKQLIGIKILATSTSGKTEESDLYAYTESLQDAAEMAGEFFATDKNLICISGTNLDNPKYTTDDVFVFRIYSFEINKFYSDTDTEDMTISRSLYIKSGISVNLHMMKNRGQRLVVLTADYNGFELPGEQGTGIIEDTIANGFTTELVVKSNRGNIVSALVAIVIAGK